MRRKKRGMGNLAAHCTSASTVSVRSCCGNGRGGSVGPGQAVRVNGQLVGEGGPFFSPSFLIKAMKDKLSTSGWTMQIMPG